MLGGTEDTPTIFTPDLNSRVVKSMLCLFYTGRVNVCFDELAEVNAALELLGRFHFYLSLSFSSSFHTHIHY